MIRTLLALLASVSCLLMAGCGSSEGELKPEESIANDLKNADKASGEVGGKGAPKKADQ